MKFIIYICFFLSGMAGLIYQVVWSKYFNLFLGITSYSVAILLATFMGGLALGNHIFGKFADKSKNPLRLYAYLELGIGITCALFPLYFDGLFNLYFTVAKGSIPNSPGNLLLKIAFSIITILLPTTLMGGTLPVMSKFIIKQISDVGAKVGLLYFLNTVGAILGTLIGGYFIIHTLGVDFSMQLSSFVNIAIGITTYYLSKNITGEFSVSQNDTEGIRDDAGHEITYPDYKVKIVLIMIGISGFVSMLYEVVWTRMLALIIGSAVQSFAIMLFTFITGIAAGSYIIHKVLSKRINHLLWFAIIELLIAISIIAVLPLYMRLPYYFNIIGSSIPKTESMFLFYEVTKIIICFIVMFLPTLFIGMTLPIASHINTKSISNLGIGVGDTFSVNTLGNLLGSLFAGFLLLPVFGMENSMKTGIIINLLTGVVLLTITELKKAHKITLTIISVFISVFIVYYQFIDKEYIQRGSFRIRNRVAKTFEEFINNKNRENLLFYKEGKGSLVSVTKNKRGTLILRINGKPDASSEYDMPTQLWSGLLGVILHNNPEDIFVLGMGSGVTAGVAAINNEVKNVELLEVSKEVIEAGKLFKDVNFDVLNNRKVKVINSDGREYLRLNPDKKYDIIISEPSNPWIAGLASLFTIQYFEEVKSHLKDNGIFIQWFQAYETNDRIVNIMFNTIGNVFRYSYVFAPATLDFLIVASEKPLNLNKQRIYEKFSDPIFSSAIKDKNSIGIPDTIGEFASINLIGEKRFRTYYGRGDNELVVNEDKFPIIEYEAPKAFFIGRTSDIIFSISETNINYEYSGLFTKELIKDFFFSLNKNEILDFIRSCDSRGQKQIARSGYSYIMESGLDRENIHIINTYPQLFALYTFINNFPKSHESYNTDKCINLLQNITKYIEQTTSVFYRSNNPNILYHLNQCMNYGDNINILRNIQNIYFILGDSDGFERTTERLLSSGLLNKKERLNALALAIRHYYYKGNFERIYEILNNVVPDEIRDSEVLTIIKEMKERKRSK
ncbi:MAG: fused MFS/spermidine synthase [Deltaproteobacteria bacterium]|nr:fused MFS/spermidine synthase [Deltaproteobacteria bacterium]